jgi:hypothetical protein
MRKINHRQYKLSEIRPKANFAKGQEKFKRGKRANARLDRRSAP